LVKDTFSAYINIVSKILEKNNIPMIYNAIGIGKMHSIQKRRYRKIFNRKNIIGISCRCDKSRFCSTLKIHSEMVQSTFDTAVLCRELISCDSKYTGTEICVGLGIMRSYRFKRQTLINFWISIIDALEEKGISWKCFSTGSADDEDLAKEILSIKGVQCTDKNYISRPLSPVDLLKNYQFFDRIISFRLHSHIIAYALGVPSIAIVWDRKIQDFFFKINRQECCFHIDDSVDKIIQKILAKDIFFNNEENLKRDSVKREVELVFIDFLNSYREQIQSKSENNSAQNYTKEI